MNTMKRKSGLSLLAGIIPMIQYLFPLSIALLGIVFMGASAHTESVTVKDFVYKHTDGEAQEIKIFFPPNHDPSKSKVPGVIFFHGGAWGGRSLGSFSHVCQYLASRGLVAATANYRALGRWKKAPCIVDAKSAFRWFKQHANEFGIDPTRIIAGGGSAGGHIAVVATLAPGLNDPADPKDIDTSVVAYLLVSPAFDNPEFKGNEEVDVQRYLKADLPPAFVIFGTADVWKTRWAAVYDKLQSLGNKTTEVWIARNQPHDVMGREPWRRVSYIAMDHFLVKLGLLKSESPLKLPDTGERLELERNSAPTTQSHSK